MTEFDKSQDKGFIPPVSFSWKTPHEQTEGRWEQAMAMDAAVEDQLALARANRSQAETTRQRIANEILEATKEACQELIADGERALEQARHLEAEAELRRQEAQRELEEAQKARAEADIYRERVMAEVQQQSLRELEQARIARAEVEGYRDKVMTEVQQQAQELLDRARSAAERECEEIKQHASQEAQRLIAQAEMIKSAVQEEMEAQRIYAEAARLKAESHEVLAQVMGNLGEMQAFQGNGTNGRGHDVEATHEWVSESHPEQPGDEAAPSVPGQTVAVERKRSNGRKKSSAVRA